MSGGGGQLAGGQVDARLDVDGPAAPPLANGELVFEAPWQSRAFGMAHALADAGVFTWDEFREYLIAEIGRWEAQAPAAQPYHYYERWLAALTQLLDARGLCPADLLEIRVQEFAARPHGHDHVHSHEHDDDHDHDEDHDQDAGHATSASRHAP